MGDNDRAGTGRRMLRMYVALPGLVGDALVHSYLRSGRGEPGDLRATVASMATDVGLALSEDGYAFEGAVGGALLPAGSVERRGGDDEFEHAVGMLACLSKVLASHGIDPGAVLDEAVEAVEAEASAVPRM